VSKPHRRRRTTKMQLSLRTVILIALALSVGLISSLLMKAAGTHPAQALLCGGSAAAGALLFFDKIIE
jgi:hypothetical protein